MSKLVLKTMRVFPLSGNPHVFILIGVGLLFIFLRFFDLEGRFQFGFDQVNNAWVMKEMIIDHKLPLLGMVAKGNSGIFIGPVYYYLLVPFYFIFRLDPIAAGMFAGVAGLVTFIVFFSSVSKIFSKTTALITVFIYTVSFSSISFDRVQWPVALIPLVSILIFYFLYDVLQGNTKSLIYLALSLGFSFHIHFTSVYFLLIIAAVLPIFPWKKIGISQIIISVLLFLFWFIPNIVSNFQQHSGTVSNLNIYLQTYYHGVHLKRILQLAGDAFIQYEGVFSMKNLIFLKFIIPFLFIIMLLKYEKFKKARILCYLIVLWFTVPWFVLSVYSGEISDYYFSITRPFVFLSIAYIISSFLRNSNIIVLTILFTITVLFTYSNLSLFLKSGTSTLSGVREGVLHTIMAGKTIEFKEGDSGSYLYSYYSGWKK